ncbi:MAG: NADP-dependent oxidoreductase [Hyphomicrobiaceae bacterium]
MPTNKGLVLASRPEGMPSPANFRLVESALAEPGPGQVLVRHLYLSVDPYMRGRMNEGASYAAPQALDAVMQGGTVGEVVASANERFKPGDLVVGHGGWQLYALTDGGDLRKVERRRFPLSVYLGAVGMPGVTAWYGVNRILKPKAGDTVVVSAATGAVGGVAGQLARRAGARTVGIAGGPEKCAYAVAELGYDACIDHRSPTFSAEFRAATPAGIDGLFENVGGQPFMEASARLADFARVAICGLIASYNGAPTQLPDMRVVLIRRATIQGFIVSDDLTYWPQALGELATLADSGGLKYRETVSDGLDSAPQAFIGLLTGRNFGKQIVKLA